MEKILGMIGLAKRAGKICTGGFLCEDAIKKRTSKLIIIAEDASEKSKKSITDSCKYYTIPYVEFSEKELLGKYCGGGERSVVSVNDKKFADAIRKKIDMMQ